MGNRLLDRMTLPGGFELLLVLILPLLLVGFLA